MVLLDHLIAAVIYLFVSSWSNHQHWTANLSDTPFYDLWDFRRRHNVAPDYSVVSILLCSHWCGISTDKVLITGMLPSDSRYRHRFRDIRYGSPTNMINHRNICEAAGLEKSDHFHSHPNVFPRGSDAFKINSNEDWQSLLCAILPYIVEEFLCVRFSRSHAIDWQPRGGSLRHWLYFLSWACDRLYRSRYSTYSVGFLQNCSECSAADKPTVS